MQQKNLSIETPTGLDAAPLWRDAADQMVKVLRPKKRALTTERAYICWLRDFYRQTCPGLEPSPKVFIITKIQNSGKDIPEKIAKIFMRL